MLSGTVVVMVEHIRQWWRRGQLRALGDAHGLTSAEVDRLVPGRIDDVAEAEATVRRHDKLTTARFSTG